MLSKEIFKDCVIKNSIVTVKEAVDYDELAKFLRQAIILNKIPNRRIVAFFDESIQANQFIREDRIIPSVSKMERKDMQPGLLQLAFTDKNSNISMFDCLKAFKHFVINASSENFIASLSQTADSFTDANIDEFKSYRPQKATFKFRFQDNSKGPVYSGSYEAQYIVDSEVIGSTELKESIKNGTKRVSDRFKNIIDGRNYIGSLIAYPLVLDEYFGEIRCASKYSRNIEAAEDESRLKDRDFRVFDVVSFKGTGVLTELDLVRIFGMRPITSDTEWNDLQRFVPNPVSFSLAPYVNVYSEKGNKNGVELIFKREIDEAVMQDILHSWATNSEEGLEVFEPFNEIEYTEERRLLNGVQGYR